MAIDIAKGIAQQVVNSGLRKVAGNLPGLLGLNKGNVKKDSSDFAFAEQKAQNSPNLFQFPLDVAGDPGIGNHGHYIIFFINEQANSKLSFTGTEKDKNGKDVMAREKAKRAIPDFIKQNFGGKEGYQDVPNVQGEDTIQSSGVTIGDTSSIRKLSPEQLNAALGVNKVKTNTKVEEKPDMEGGMNVVVKRPPTKRLDTAIAMYMPASVNVSYATKYEDQAISSLAKAAVGVYQGLKGDQSFSEALKAQIPAISDDFRKRGLLKALDAADAVGITGAREAVEIEQGEVIADRMELAFKNVERRSFTYDFKMIPRNSREAEEIRKIIFAFKANMLPEFLKGRDRDTMSVPNTFNIQYMYKGKENDYIHRVSECFLDKVDVTYGGDRYKTFEPHANDGAPPVETKVSLSFNEIEVMSRERIFEGY